MINSEPFPSILRSAEDERRIQRNLESRMPSRGAGSHPARSPESAVIEPAPTATVFHLMKPKSKQQNKAGGKAEQLPQSNWRRQRASRERGTKVAVTVYFHNDFHDGEEQLKLTRAPKRIGKYWHAPKNCWDIGKIVVHANDFHGLEEVGYPVPFNAAEELTPKIFGMLQQQGMIIHRRMNKIRNLGEVMTRFDKRAK